MLNKILEDRMEIKVTRTKTNRTRPEDSALGFGTVLTDHMFVMDYSQEKGWHNPEIKPYEQQKSKKLEKRHPGQPAHIRSR